MGKFSSLTMVNSSWTKEHIAALWRPRRLILVYPPCDTRGLETLPLPGRDRNMIVSIAQFRPEKNHKLQVEMVEALVKNGLSDVVLHMIGSTRVGNEGDKMLVEGLQEEIRRRGIEKNVKLAIGVSNASLKADYFAKAAMGVHTMADEHFGIGVVELQAAGVVVVAHDSAGPKKDIVGASTPPAGLLAATLQQYVEGVMTLMKKSEEEYRVMQENGRRQARRFSDEAFVQSFSRCFSLLIPNLSTSPDIPRDGLDTL